MSFLFNEDHVLLRDSAKGWLGEWFDHGQKLASFEDTKGLAAREDWQSFAIDQGFAAISVDERFGGAGLGRLGAITILEETGSVLFRSPFATSACLSVELLNAFDSDLAHQTLSDIAQGVVVGFIDGRRACTVTKNTLSGSVARVADMEIAQSLLVSVRDSDAVALYVISADDERVMMAEEPRIDITRRYYTLTFNELELSGAKCIGRISEIVFDRQCWFGQALLSAEAIGGAQRCLDLTLAYADQREQFGRKIGSFQAYKHKCADLFIDLETARSACYMAAAAEDEEEAYGAALIAVAQTRETYYRVAAESIQLHGGIGFTWDYPLHYYFKRARADLNATMSVDDIYLELANHIGGVS